MSSSALLSPVAHVALRASSGSTRPRSLFCAWNRAGVRGAGQAKKALHDWDAPAPCGQLGGQSAQPPVGVHDVGGSFVRRARVWPPSPRRRATPRWRSPPRAGRRGPSHSGSRRGLGSPSTAVPSADRRVVPLGGQRGAQLLGVLPDHVITADDCDLQTAIPSAQAPRADITWHTTGGHPRNERDPRFASGAGDSSAAPG